MGGPAEVSPAKVRVTRNGATALLSRVFRRAGYLATFGTCLNEEVLYIPRDVDTALRRKDFKQLARVLYTCEDERVVRHVVLEIERYIASVLERQSDDFFKTFFDRVLEDCSKPLEYRGERPPYDGEILLKALVVYGSNKEVGPIVLTRLMSMHRYALISEMVETAKTLERRRSCVRVLEEDVALLIDGGWDQVLRVVRKHTSNDVTKNRLDRVLAIDIGLRRGLQQLVAQGNFRKMFDLTRTLQLKGCAEFVMDLLDRNIEAVIQSRDGDVIEFVRENTRNILTQRRLESVPISQQRDEAQGNGRDG